jgi:hypothetical protein
MPQSSPRSGTAQVWDKTGATYPGSQEQLSAALAALRDEAVEALGTQASRGPSAVGRRAAGVGVAGAGVARRGKVDDGACVHHVGAPRLYACRILTPLEPCVNPNNVGTPLTERQRSGAHLHLPKG